ncbi:MAG: hypothetical protein SFZ02_11330 [bacterium]|nr:hypothetical protein [bacterium]
MMEVKIFLTADYANVDSSNKLNILGAFTQIQARNLPAVLIHLYVVAQLAFDWSEEGHRIVFIRLFNPDTKELAILSFEFDIPKAPFGQTSRVTILAPMQNVIFEEFGAYEFKLFMGEDHRASMTVDVGLRSQPKNES